MLELDPPITKPLTRKELEAKLVDYGEWGCLIGSHKAQHNYDQFAPIDYNKTEAALDKNFLKGTTIWINEHMAVGHVMYDLWIMEAIQIYPVDRIVFQRAACNHDLCMGIGSWDGWYMGYYAAILDAFRPQIPCYIRWAWKV